MKYNNTNCENSMPIPCETQATPASIQSVLAETTSTLTMIEAELESLRKFIRFDQSSENVKDIEVKDLETEVYNQRNMANRILKKAIEISQLLGRC